MMLMTTYHQISSRDDEQGDDNQSQLKKEEHREPTKEKSYGKRVCQRVESLFRGITVEPVIFCYAFGIILHVPVIQQYIHKRLSEEKGLVYNSTNSRSSCDSFPMATSEETKRFQRQVQSESSYMQLGLVFSASAPSLIVALILGAWSDHMGRRKAMGLPLFGSAIETALVLVVMYLKLPITTLLIGGFIAGSCGFFPTMVLSVFSYMADITDESERAFRLGVLEAIAFLSGMLSHLTSGYLVYNVGFRPPYWILLFLHTFALFYVVFILPESRVPNPTDQSQFKYFSMSHVRAIVLIFTKTRSGGHWRMAILMMISGLMTACSIGFGSIIVLYALDRPLCCNAIMIGYYLALSFFAQAVGAVFGIKYLGMILSEHVLMQVGMLSITLSLLFMAFVTSKQTLFLVPFVACLGGIPTPTIRAMMSKMVDPDEQGALFAAIATLETLCTLVGALIFNSIYPLLIRVGMKGLTFVVMASLMVVAFILVEIVRRKDRKYEARKEVRPAEKPDAGCWVVEEKDTQGRDKLLQVKFVVIIKETMEGTQQISEDVLNTVLYGNQLYSSFSYEDYIYGSCTTYLPMVPVPDGHPTPSMFPPGKLDESYGNQSNPFRLQLPSKPLPNGLKIAGVSHGWTYRYGVFCSEKPIKSGTRFGPYNGVVHRKDELNETEDNVCMWEVFLEDGTISHYVDSLRSPENWMKFVRCAHHADEQNTNLVQRGSKLYYETSRDINEGEELLVWYGDGYEMTMGLPLKLRTKELEQDSTNGPSFPCERCGKLFAYDYYRDKHLKYTRCLDKGDRRFPCSLCDRSFDKRDRLRIHVLHVHEKHRPHQCTVCDKRFSQSSSLNKHMRVHSGERPYKCPHCEKAFTASSILRTHIRQHSGEKPFKCKHCGRAFASHAAHDSHVRRTHMRAKTWTCEFCGLAFSDVKQLHFHRTVHGQERAISCEWCHREFQSKFLRDIHQNTFECLVGERIPTSPMIS